MEGQTIVEKTPWRKRRTILGRGLTVIALCKIVLCVALAVGIAVIVSKSCSRDAPDSDAAEPLPFKPEALVWKSFWHKLLKKMTIATRTAVIRPDAIGPSTKRTETITPNQGVVTNGAGRPDTVAPVTNRTETATPAQHTVTNAATQPDKITKTPKPKNTKYLCQMDEGQRTVDDILKDMDVSADRCNDFYQYACGGFLNHTDVPDDKLSVSASTLSEGKLEKQLIEIFDTDENDEPKSFQLAKTLYKSCINPSKNSTEAMKLRLSNLLKFILVSHQSSSHPSFNWTTVLYSFHDLGYSANYFFDFHVDVDIENSTARAIYLDEAVLGHPRLHLQQPRHEIYNYYEKYIRDVAEALNVTENVKDRLNKAKDVQVELAKISSPKDQRPEAIGYQRMTLMQFIEVYSGLSWMEDYLKNVLSETIDVDAVVIVKSSGYFTKLGELWKRTSDNKLSSYIIWRALIDSAFYMRIPKPELVFKTSLVGVVAQQTREQECVGVVLNKFPLVVSAMYAKRCDDDDAMKGIKEFLEDYTEALAETLKGPGLHNTAIKQAAEKHANASVVFHPTKKEMEILEDLYKDLKLSEDDFFKNSLHLSRFASDYTLKKLRQTTPESVWASSTMSIFKQARYSHAKNSLDVSALIMRPPHFSNDQTAFFNYDGIGFLMSRKFASAFDYNGRHYDQRGNVIKGVQSTSDSEYNIFKECVYHNYMEQIRINEYRVRVDEGNLGFTDEELFADLAGLKIAYSTYMKWIAKNKDAPSLTVNGPTPKQLFWISTAQTWCTKYDLKSRGSVETADLDGSEWLRVVGMMSNTREWLDDFSCSQTLPMYGWRNCTIW